MAAKDNKAADKAGSKAEKDGSVDSTPATPAAPATKEVIIYYVGTFNSQGQFDGEGTYT